MIEVKAGVPLFDSYPHGIWVYLPIERWEAENSRGWVCDTMVIARGVVTSKSGMRFSDRYLSSLFEEPPE